jgi:predicted ATPase
VASHSPILLACPGATIYWLNDTGLQETEYQDVEHVRLLHAFTTNPDAILWCPLAWRRGGGRRWHPTRWT